MKIFVYIAFIILSLGLISCIGDDNFVDDFDYRSPIEGEYFGYTKYKNAMVTPPIIEENDVIITVFKSEEEDSILYLYTRGINDLPLSQPPTNLKLKYSGDEFIAIPDQNAILLNIKNDTLNYRHYPSVEAIWTDGFGVKH